MSEISFSRPQGEVPGREREKKKKNLQRRGRKLTPLKANSTSGYQKSVATVCAGVYFLFGVTGVGSVGTVVLD